MSGPVDEVMDAMGFARGGPDISGGAAAEALKQAILSLERANEILARDQRLGANTIATALLYLRPVLERLDAEVSASIVP